jgi:hypothetical protein
MKIIDNGNFTTIELETQSGQATYMSSIKSDIPNDRRGWVRDPETIELSKYLQDNSKQAQLVVKVGEVYNRLR